jgi:hypothetical protein
LEHRNTTQRVFASQNYQATRKTQIWYRPDSAIIQHKRRFAANSHVPAFCSCWLQLKGLVSLVVTRRQLSKIPTILPSSGMRRRSLSPAPRYTKRRLPMPQLQVSVRWNISSCVDSKRVMELMRWWFRNVSMSIVPVSCWGRYQRSWLQSDNNKGDEIAASRSPYHLLKTVLPW